MPNDTKILNGASHRSLLSKQDAHTQKRNSAEKRFRIYGMVALSIGVLFLIFLFASILRSGLPAFTQTVVNVEFVVSQEEFDKAESKILKTKEYQDIFVAALNAELEKRNLEIAYDKKTIERIVGKPGGTIRSYFTEDPSRVGQLAAFKLTASSRVDGYFNGRVTSESLVDSRFLKAVYLDLVDALHASGIIRQAFNWNFITGTDSGVDNPGGAGLGASVIGSFFMMLVVLFLSLPIGVAASIYLEEFAPRNRWTDFIEVNISNLAAVPSIVFGILGLAVFIQFAGLPQSAPLVGGLVLTLMTLPTIIISTRASLAAVPPSIRDAALGVGASKMQSVFHHVLPLAMPGILTGTILGMAHALGETAPLLMIGMVAFVVDAPNSITDAATLLPVQIFMWADFPEQAFQSKTAAAIVVLLVFLILMNAIAVFLRKKFERRW